MTIQFCNSCKKNNVNTRVEWRAHPSGKNKPFDIDKNEWHSPCPYWKPTPKGPISASTNQEAKQILTEYNKTFPKENEQLKKIESGISTAIEFIVKHDMMLRDMNKKVFGEDVEVIISQLQEENAGLKEALRLRALETGDGKIVK